MEVIRSHHCMLASVLVSLLLDSLDCTLYAPFEVRPCDLLGQYGV